MFIKSIYKVERTLTEMTSTFQQVSIYQHIFLLVSRKAGADQEN